MLTASHQKRYVVEEKGENASQFIGTECRVVWNAGILKPRKDNPRIVGMMALEPFFYLR
jgi:hypothetical protein